jgi:DNA-3-methyladenine glycosylase
VSARAARSFYARPATDVAPDLLGAVLVREFPGGTLLRARIVETEAYEEGDPASHSFRGQSRRNTVMFGPPGHLYVYFIYGMHFCMNVVTGRAGEGSAVLLRAAEPLEGLEGMADRRGTDRSERLCSGPARLCEALGVDLTLNGADLTAAGQLTISRERRVPEGEIVRGPRVGITVGTELHWRFHLRGSPFVSRIRGPRPGTTDRS